MERHTLQLLRDADRKEFWYVSNESHRAPRTFDDKAGGKHFAPRWGSLALLQLAVQARAVHLEPVRVELRDVSRLRLPDEIADSVNEAIVEALRAGELDTAQSLLEGPGGPYVVLSVELESEDGAQIVVERFGGFEVTERAPVQTDEPLRALVSAASKLLSIS